MALQIKVLATKPDNPSSIPKNHMVKERLDCILALFWAHTHMHMHTCARTYTPNVIFFKYYWDTHTVLDSYYSSCPVVLGPWFFPVIIVIDGYISRGWSASWIPHFDPWPELNHDFLTKILEKWCRCIPSISHQVAHSNQPCYDDINADHLVLFCLPSVPAFLHWNVIVFPCLTDMYFACR